MISVILPVYNDEQFLLETFESKKKKKDIELEVIVVDDGSRDNSLALCRKIEKEDGRVRVFTQRNAGVSAARNFGISQAHGEYIAFLDQDDVFLDGALARNLQILMDKKADFIKFARKDIVVVNGKNTQQTEYNQFEFCTLNLQNIGLHYMQLRKNMMFSSIWNGIYRKDFLLKNSIAYNEAMKGGCEDQWFNLCLLLPGFSAVYVPELGYVHYIRKGTSTSTKFSTSMVEAFSNVCRLEMQFIDKLPLNPKEREAIACEYVWRMYAVLVRYPDKGIIGYSKCEFGKLFDACAFGGKSLQSRSGGSALQTVVYRLFRHKMFALLGASASLLRMERRLLKCL